MSFLDYLPPDAVRALKAGRGIPFLIDHRHPEHLEYKLTVVGVLDTLKFHAALYGDAPPSEPPVHESVLCGPLFVPDLKLPNDEAHATHTLWSMWDSGVRDAVMRYVATVARYEKLQQLLEAMYPGSDGTPAPTARPAASSAPKEDTATTAHSLKNTSRSGKAAAKKSSRARKEKRR